MIVLAIAAILVFVLVSVRFVFASFNPSTGSPVSVTKLGTASAIPTATTITQVAGMGGSGTVLAAATPYATAIVSGYPRPDVESSQEQGILQNMGNPDKAILISLDGQFLQAYDHGKLALWTYVTTGAPDLPTPPGYFQVMEKESPYLFSSECPPGSACWYYPTKGTFALLFEQGGYFIHDAWWRTVYGPGLTALHYDAGRGEWQDGSHGCVNTPIEAMAWLFLWAEVGTPVTVF